jgi:hypothetical protein
VREREKPSRVVGSESPALGNGWLSVDYPHFGLVGVAGPPLGNGGGLSTPRPSMEPPL